MMDANELLEALRADAEQCAEVPPCTTLYMDHDGDAVALMTDSKANVVGEWIPGEGADICLYRDRDSGRVIGVRLPMRYGLLMVGDSRSPVHTTFSGSSYVAQAELERIHQEAGELSEMLRSDEPSANDPATSPPKDVM